MKRLIKASQSFVDQIINNEVIVNINNHNTNGIVYDFNEVTDTVWIDVNEKGYEDTWTKDLKDIKFVDLYLENLRLEYLEHKKGN